MEIIKTTPKPNTNSNRDRIPWGSTKGKRISEQKSKSDKRGDMDMSVQSLAGSISSLNLQS